MKKQMKMKQQQQQQQTDSPPETHSSDVSEEDCADNGIPESMHLDVALQIGGGASGTTAVDVEVDVDGEEQLRSSLPDPPSRSSNSAATPSNQQSTTAAALASSSTTSIGRPPLAPAPSQQQHPSSSTSDVVIPDGGTPILRVTSVEVAVEETNSYVELAPTGDDTREPLENADEEKNTFSSQKQNQPSPKPKQEEQTTHCRFMANHEHSNSLVHLPLLDNHKEGEDDGIGSYNLAAAKMEALASVSSALDELHAEAEEESPPSFDAEDSETERDVCSSADPPGSSHERSTSIVIRNASEGEGEDHQSQADNDDVQTQSTPTSDLLKGAEELAEAMANASTPPPINNDDEEVDTSNSTTPSDPTMDPEEETSPASTSPQHHDLMHQRQPTGTHISEGLLTIEQHQYEEVSIPDTTATRTPSPPPLSLDGDVAPPLPFAEKEIQFDNERERSQSQRISSPQSTAPSPFPRDIQLQSQQQPHPLSLPKQNPNQPSKSLQSPSRITYTSHQTGALSPPPPTNHPGRRSITLRLLEEISPPPPTTNIASPLLSSVKSLGSLNNTPFRSLRRFRSLSLSSKSATSVATAAAAASSSSVGGGVDSNNDNNGMSTLDEKAPSPQGKLSGSESGSTIDRGLIVVSWYEGTTSSEMQEHVFNCVLRKLNGDKKTGGAKIIKLEDVRLLDENVTPHGEVVLCPFLPDGSHFLLRFKTSVERPRPTSPPPPSKIYNRMANPYAAPPYASRAPDSPSAEPSPFPSTADLHSLGNGALNGMHIPAAQQQQQMQVMNAVAALLQQQQQQQQHGRGGHSPINLSAAMVNGLPRMPNMMENHNAHNNNEYSASTREEKKEESSPVLQPTNMMPSSDNNPAINPKKKVIQKQASTGGINSPMTSMEPINENSTTDQLIEQQLQQLNALFSQRQSFGGGVAPMNLSADEGTSSSANNVNATEQLSDDQARAYHRDEKKQVIFLIANYLVLFMSLIALSAEIQSRLPQWMQWVQENYDSVQNCATDRDALIECLSNGDLSGLIASFLLWGTQSAAAKRIFLFGFDTPKKLWTVVYEALVTAVCWGISYLFIRRGLNPNTRQNFVHKYWKDAVYGSLAGFNAAFMKAVLKNLVPQDMALEALEGRQLKIFHWLGTMLSDESV